MIVSYANYKNISLCDGKMPVELGEIRTLSEADASMAFVRDRIQFLEMSVINDIDDIIDFLEEEMVEGKITSSSIDDIFNVPDAYRWYRTPYRRYSSSAPSLDQLLNPKHTRFHNRVTTGVSYFDGYIDKDASVPEGWRSEFLALDRDSKRQIVLRAAIILSHGAVESSNAARELRTMVWAPGRNGNTSGWTIKPLFENDDALDTVIDLGIMLIDLKKAMERLSFDWNRFVLHDDPSRMFWNSSRASFGSGVLSDEENGSEASLPLMYLLIGRKYGELVTNTKDIRGSLVRVWNSRRSTLGIVVNGRGKQLYIRPLDPLLVALVSSLPLNMDHGEIMSTVAKRRLDKDIAAMNTPDIMSFGTRPAISNLLLSTAMDNRMAINNLVFASMNVTARRHCQPSWLQPDDPAEWVEKYEQQWGKNTVIERYSLANSSIAVMATKVESAQIVEKIDALSTLLRNWRDTYLEEHEDVVEWNKKGGLEAERHRDNLDKAAKRWVDEVTLTTDWANTMRIAETEEEERTVEHQLDRFDFFKRMMVLIVAKHPDDKEKVLEVGKELAMTLAARSHGELSEVEKDLLDSKPEGASDWIGDEWVLPHMFDNDDTFVDEISEVLGRDVSLPGDGDE